eukprot:Skav206786  [mRNA]  locus=scaffold1990:26503:29722:- [translate_table: standard]
MRFTLSALFLQAAVALECGKPVDKAPVIFPAELVNDLPRERMFSGYVNVTEKDFLFYWFVEAKDVQHDTPVILWSNGGPGLRAFTRFARKEALVPVNFEPTSMAEARWFSLDAVRKALNVCGNAGQASFGSCGAGCIMFPKSFGANDTLDNVGMISKLLELKIPVLMTYGMKDTTCNYEGVCR